MIQVIPAISSDFLSTVWEIRRVVFVDEQACPEDLEYEFEEESFHFLAYYNSEPAGACRWRETQNGIKLERFAVLSQFRRKGIADAMVKFILNEVKNKGKKIYLHAQLSAMPLYAKNGFISEGEMFSEAGIDHFKMVIA